MIKFLRNVWKFRKELAKYDNTDWDSTERMILRGLQDLKLHPGEAEDARVRVLDIFHRRQSNYYLQWQMENSKPDQYEVWKDEEGTLKAKNITTQEDIDFKIRIAGEAIKLEESDYKYALDQIRIYSNQWWI